MNKTLYDNDIDVVYLPKYILKRHKQAININIKNCKKKVRAKSCDIIKIVKIYNSNNKSVSVYT